MVNLVNITSGSDASMRFEFKDSEGTSIAVSSPEIILADSIVSSRAVASLVDGAAGVVSVFIEGSDPIPVGHYSFRVRVTLSDGNTLASEAVTLNVR